MVYNPVPTVATGDLWTASNHNTYIRDNFAASIPDIFQAAGDLVYASAADAAARLPIGSNGLLLSIVNGLPSWGAGVPVIGFAQATSGYGISTGWADFPGLSINLNMPIAGKIIAIGFGLARRLSVYDEAALRLVIDGTANPVINQDKKYIADDQTQANLVNIFYKSVSAGSRNIKLQGGNTDGVNNVVFYWGNLLAIGFPGA